MKPKLTIAVRRGLKDIADLAGADIDAESGFDYKRFKGKRLADANAALRWIACLDDKPRPPKVDQEAARRAVEASQCIAGRLPANVAIKRLP